MRERKRGRGDRCNLDTNVVLLDFKLLQGSCQSFKSGNLLQEAETVSNLIEVVVSILPWVNFDTLLPALKQYHTMNIKYCMHSNCLKETCDGACVNYKQNVIHTGQVEYIEHASR